MLDQSKQGEDEACPAFDLQSFFPYLVRVFYSDVTAALAEIYTTDHGLTPSEWRTMAILSEHGKIPASEIVDRSSMDKVSVSRAVKRMHERGLLEKSSNLEDARSTLLDLSQKGKTIYADIVPKVLAAEKRMLKGVSDRDFQSFLKVMSKVRNNLEG